MMRRRCQTFWIGVLAGFWLLLPARPAGATMTLPVSLERMTARAGMIFVGRCVAVSEAEDERGLPATYATFEVVHPIKGVSGARVTVKHFGTASSPHTLSLVPELAPGEEGIVQTARIMRHPYRYRPDEEVVLFLYPESRWGFTSPIGFGQGLFRVFEAEDGTRTVRNHFGNIFLQFPERDVTTTPLPALTTDSAALPLDYTTFIDAVERMVAR